MTEPWLRGPLSGVPACVMPVFFSFMQAREDLANHLEGLSAAQIWRPIANTSVGFHLKHIAGSVDRLTSYLMNRPLTDAQLNFLKAESESGPGQLGADLPVLLGGIENALDLAQQQLLTLDPNSFYQARTVGRRLLPTTVLGLLVHLAEHMQRHVGQAIVLSKMVRQTDE